MFDFCAIKLTHLNKDQYSRNNESYMKLAFFMLISCSTNEFIKQ